MQEEQLMTRIIQLLLTENYINPEESYLLMEKIHEQGTNQITC